MISFFVLALSPFLINEFGFKMNFTIDGIQLSEKEEEQIYDFQIKKRVRYHVMMEQILPITEIAQIFTLNNKLFGFVWSL